MPPGPPRSWGPAPTAHVMMTTGVPCDFKVVSGAPAIFSKCQLGSPPPIWGSQPDNFP
jgi:hypothetical protein